MRYRSVLAGIAVIAIANIPVPASSAQAPTDFRCSVSPAVPGSRRLLSHAKSDTKLFAPFVAFDGFQHGTWLELSYGGLHDGTQTYSVLSYRRGHEVRVRMRTTLDYGSPAADVAAVGVLPDQTVVATADKDPWRGASGYPPAQTWALRHGHRTALRAPRAWWAVMARAVTDDGHIVGLGLSGSHQRPTVHIITWATVAARPRPVPDTNSADPQLIADGEGDIAWETKTSIAKVRLQNGQVRVLADPDDTGLAPGSGIQPQLAQGHLMWSNGGEDGMLRWDLDHVAPRGPIEATIVTHDTAGDRWPDFASPSGTLVDGLNPNPRFVYFADGHRRRLPAEASSDGDALNAVDGNTVAYTSRHDHLPHLMSCHLQPAT